MEDKITFGKFIQTKRKEKGFTQKQLANKLYVTESAISKWERGLSYPDLSLIPVICETLNISEHELITASEDHRQRKIEDQSNSYIKIIKTYSWFFYIAYGITLISCFIGNLVSDHTLSWFFIVLTSLMAAFSITNIPVLFKKHKAAATITSLFVSIILILLSSCLYTHGDWFFTAAISVIFGFSVVFLPVVLNSVNLPSNITNNKTLFCFIIDTVLLFILIPIALQYSGNASLFYPEAMYLTLFGLSYAWLMMISTRYVKTNGLFRTAICMIISGIYVLISNSVVSVIIDKKPFKLVPMNLSNWSEPFISGNTTFIAFITLISLAFCFIVGGILLTIKNNKR